MFFVVCLGVLFCSHWANAETDTTTESQITTNTSTKEDHLESLRNEFKDFHSQFTSFTNQLKQLQDVMDGLSKQVMLQQFYSQEKVRGEGNSGLNNVRLVKDGSKNYYETSILGGRGYMAMHDHSNYNRLLGLGELDVIMNGVKFITRHNDYNIRMPSKTSKKYHAMEDIAFPDVPPSVLNKSTVEEQVSEMHEYFKAFKNQDRSHRDYSPYFKPVLCYLEGGWTKASKNIDEPFHSDRHSIDASNWFELMEKVQFSAYTGSKSLLENFAFLPTAIYKVENGVPKFAQWNYRIACHPIKDGLPTHVFKPIDDLMMRFPRKMHFERLSWNREMRFHVSDKNKDQSTYGNSLLDKLMSEIPGKDNYLSYIHDNSNDLIKDDIRFNNQTVLNTGFYHRYYRTRSKDAMGNSQTHRGFSDSNLWVAQNTRPNIISMEMSRCVRKKCKSWHAKYTYALPLEIVYLSPLNKWNPYYLESDVPHKVITDNGKRDGGLTKERAFNGTNPLYYFYRTPASMFVDPRINKKAVLDKQGLERIVTNSGPPITTYYMKGIGRVRLRFPILPLHGEGAMVWQELNALKDMTMKMNRYSNLFQERPGVHMEDTTGGFIRFKLPVSGRENVRHKHSHDVFLHLEEFEELKHGQDAHVKTSTVNGHFHDLILRYDKKLKQTKIYSCDSHGPVCWPGGHKPFLERIMP